MAGRSAIARRLCQLGFGGVACCAFSWVVATSVSAQQTGASQTLQVAAWNLRHLTKEEAEELKDKPKPTRRKWRNTFGAERRTPSWRKRTRHGFDADIVALQGLKTVSEVRRIFPATTHQLIMSRAALSELQGEIAGARGNNQNGFTAIAIRSRAGLRVAGQHYFAVPALGPSLSSRTAPVIALRLSVDRDAIWVLSVEFRSDCGQTASDGNPDCDGQRLMSDDLPLGRTDPRRRNPDHCGRQHRATQRPTRSTTTRRRCTERDNRLR